MRRVSGHLPLDKGRRDPDDSRVDHTRTVVALAIDPTDTTIYGAVSGGAGTSGYIISSQLSNTTGAWSYFVPSSLPQSSPEDIAIAAGNVYWINLGTQTGTGDGGVFMCPMTGCTQPVSAIGGLPLTGASLVADAANLYFMDNTMVYRCALPSCPNGPTPLSGSNLPLAGRTLTHDATALYWVDEFGALWKLAK